MYGDCREMCCRVRARTLGQLEHQGRPPEKKGGYPMRGYEEGDQNTPKKRA